VSRRLLVPAASTVAMLVVLLGLGTWQVRRLAWKNRLLAQIDAAEQAPAIPLPAHPAPFAKVAITGHPRADLAVRYGAEGRDTAAGPVLGAQLVEPLERPGAETVLVDLGWLPFADPVPPAAPQQGFVGFVRPPEHAGWFSAADDPGKRLFYTLDPQAIGAALGLRVAPFTLVALGAGRSASDPDPARQLPRPPNNHLQYAITWYGLAAVLLLVFGTYVRKGPGA
jgi:surfeit locus 1 family protein